MTEEEAQQWLAARWDATTIGRLSQLRELVLEETARQNLISPSTFSSVWARHIVDSAQLIPMAGPEVRNWIDIGTGAGFPGLVAAILLPDCTVTLAEPRGRRANFLAEASRALEVTNTIIKAARCQQIEAGEFDVISARAVAALPELLTITAHLRCPNTRYLLPKGQSAPMELETLPVRWQRLFHVEQSITDPQSSILVGVGVT